ncbi:hypothetical protein [Bradyrhizobium monzae]|uniref:hypothetical protein n=1 Tax=Bradyrhizobium sp. Oc8 TaxID=2876780 RepID=UPI001F31B057|nr:hypothetical protein [Bradyrhizobium sp. Oc8]
MTDRSHSPIQDPRVNAVIARLQGASVRATGLRDIAVPDGQNTPTLGQSTRPKIFHFTEIRKRRMCRATRPKEEGRIAIVTNAGRTAVDLGHIGAKGFAGRATVSENVARTTGVICVRQNRVVLAPGACAPSLVVMRVARPGMRNRSSARRRGQ